MARYQLYGGGGNNPCGAYYPAGGPLDNLMGAPNSDCPIPRFYYTLDTTQSITPIQTTRGRGICCDPFKRVSDNFSYTWENQKKYKIFDTVAGIGEDCPACFFHAYRQHTSSAPYTTITYGKNKPCETIGNNRQCTKYIKYWSTCKFLTEQEALPTNCTMHNSFGLIMANTQNDTHAGSPNGSCSSNCMQLGIEFFEERVAGKYLSSAQYPPNNYSDKTAYDCEAEQRDRKGNTGPTGPKLIWAGFAKNQWDAPILTSSQPNPFPSPPQTPIPTNSSPVPGEDEIVEITWDPTLGNNPSPQLYPFRGTISGDYYYGYLPLNANPANSWGLLHYTTGVPGSTFPQNESKLWARKSTWRIMPPGGSAPTTSTDDAFACCKYVSFGCTDPSFGSFNPDVELDCNGIPKGNTPDDDGNCLTINDAQGICWENGLQCSKCIDTTGSPDPNDLNFNPNYNNYFVLPADDPTGECTQEIFDSCGATGFLSEDAWIAMRNARPTSWLYGGGAAALGLPNTTTDYGRARFWDKDGRDVTGGNFGRPLCQCNNSGCMYPQADNYSQLNTTDCNNDPAPPNIFGVLNQYGDVRCCTIKKFGCPESTSANYFCKIDLNGNGSPDNQEFCMNPNTGIPCNELNANCGPFNGGEPLSKGNNSIPGFNNPTVTLIDDGTCDLVLKPGCKDDGGISAGGIFANPVNPGYSALNFDSTATIHVQSRCEYAFGCPDPLAENVRNDLPVCGNVTLQSKADEINSNNPGLFITSSFVKNNLIPTIECCDYQIPGTGPGCTDPNALNYNPLADEDCLGVVAGTDTSCCIYSIEGCTDPNAINFNPAATLDDSSCIYDGDYPVEGDNFLDGTPIEICREPLTKEEVLMNVCQPTEIQSEVFIERGKQSVFEPNQRLDEVKTIGGLEIYGYGFYNIKEEI